MTSSLTHYFVCHKSQNFDPQECVHNNSSRKVGGGRRYVQFSHQKWTNDILLTCPRFKPSQEKIRATITAHVTSSSKIPTNLIGVNNYPVIKTQIHSTRVCFCFLKRHIATHLASPSIKLFLLGLGGALPPTCL